MCRPPPAAWTDRLQVSRTSLLPPRVGGMATASNLQYAYSTGPLPHYTVICPCSRSEYGSGRGSRGQPEDQLNFSAFPARDLTMRRKLRYNIGNYPR